MITLNTWQLVAAIVLIFAFGWGTGRTMGESRAWAKMDRQEEQPLSQDLFHPMEQTFGNVVYRTEGSTILAVEIRQYGDGRDESYLMRTPNGRYFMQSHQGFKGGTRYDYIHSYSREEAMRSFNGMKDQRVSFAEAFGEELQEA